MEALLTKLFKHTHTSAVKNTNTSLLGWIKRVDDLAVETFTVGPALPFPADMCTQTHRQHHVHIHTPSPAEKLPQGSGKLLPSPTQ